MVVALINFASRLGRRVLPALSILAVLAGAVSLAAPAGAAAATSSSGPLLWTAPAPVDQNPLDSLTCVSKRLCVGVDGNGGVVWSTNPTAGPGRWQRSGVDGNREFTGIACPSALLCVGVDSAGNAVTSTDPTGGRSDWTVARIDTNQVQGNTDNAGSILLRGVSCPSTSLCVAVDSVGDALTSTAPTTGPAGWTATHIDDNRTNGCTGSGLTCQPPLVGVSCPSVSECAAVDFSGNVLTTPDPLTTTPWQSATTDGGHLSSLYGVSCPSVSFCATVDGSAGKAITFSPAASSDQTTRSLPYSMYGIWCVSTSLCLASVETQGGLSGLLGSFNPAAPASTWSLSSLGGIDAVSCPERNMCLAADDEGNIASGVTTRAVRSELAGSVLSGRHLPTIATLDRTHSDRIALSSLIPAQVSLEWTARIRHQTVVVGMGQHSFSSPGQAHLTLALTPSGRSIFKAARRSVTVVASATFTASTGQVRGTSSLTFTHPPKPKRKRKH